MSNPWKTFGIAYKPLSCVVFHRDELIGLREFARWITDDVYTKSPFFKNKPHDHKIKVITSGPRGSGALGTDLVTS